LHPGADSYRVLGADSHAAVGELRRNMVLLQRWLHLDADRGGQHRMFVARVTTAWNDVKTPERRSTYDLAQRRVNGGTSPGTKTRTGSRSGKRRSRRRLANAPNRGMTGVLRRALLFLLARA
jgi:hypothetical protein